MLIFAPGCFLPELTDLVFFYIINLNASGESVLLSRRIDKNGDKCANT